MKEIFKALSFITLFFVFSLCASAQSTTPGTGIGNDNGGPKQSWQDIYRNPNLRPQFPKYDIEGRQIGFNALCISGERIRSRYKYVVTINFTKFMYDYLYTDRVRFVEQCIRWDRGVCISHESVKVEIPLKQPIQVLKKNVDTEDNSIEWGRAFEKDFVLKECPEDPKFPF